MNDILTNETLRVNRMPAPTWHRLKVNETEIFVAPSNKYQESTIESSCEDEIENLDYEMELNNLNVSSAKAFDEALRDYKDECKPITSAQRAVEIAASDDVDPQDLNIPALSTYQRCAVLNETNASPAQFFEMGAGTDVLNFSRTTNENHIVLEANSSTTSDAVLYIHPTAAVPNFVQLDVIANENSECGITIIYEDSAGAAANKISENVAADNAANNGDINTSDLNNKLSASSKESSITVGCNLRVFAGRNAKVNVCMIQALTSNTQVIDNSGYSLCARACVNVEHRVLGAAKTITGLAADMHGDVSALNVVTRYIGMGSQNHDFNYSVKQRGRNTTSNIDANGVLTGEAKKTLRGTIDFVHGCKGSLGNERETVLLASEGAENETTLKREVASASKTEECETCEGQVARHANPLKTTCKTVPVILCDEEDVAGNHGATIGHVRPEARFYLNARGLNDANIERLFLSSFIDEAQTTFANNERVIAQIDAFTKEMGIYAQKQG